MVFCQFYTVFFSCYIIVYKNNKNHGQICILIVRMHILYIYNSIYTIFIYDPFIVKYILLPTLYLVHCAHLNDEFKF